MAEVIPFARPHAYSLKAVFDTFQGEGARMGTRAVFVRFAGCNLWSGLEEQRGRGVGACASWCDTDFAKGKPFTAPAILGMLEQAWPLRLTPDDGLAGRLGGVAEPRWCVLTGGEPLLQVDQPLIDLLHDAGWQIAVETNGTCEPPRGIDWLTCSPKLPADGRRDGPTPNGLAITHADELKVVLPGHLDHDWTDADLLALAEYLRPSARFVQPMDPKAQHPRLLVKGRLFDGRPQALSAAFRRCTAFVRAHPEWRIGIQMQKVAGLP